MWQLSYGVSNKATAVLFSFLHHFLQLISKCSKQISGIVYPQTFKTAQRMIDFNCPSFEQFVVCPKCDAVYSFSDCVINESGQEMSGACRHVEYPHHTQAHFRKACGEKLLTLKKNKRKRSLKPKKLYCYQNLKDAIHGLINRPNFLEKCDKWRERVTEDDLLTDIYDGRIWKQFQKFDGKEFLALPNNFAVGLGCDWFQPYKHVSYSVGVLYLVLFNLPREERFKMENIILVGIIPGPSESKKTMNSYLGPFVRDMLEFWEGENIWHEFSQTFVTIRMALVCVMCDIPAARKVCGFAGHSAVHGCSKCYKEFQAGLLDYKLDYSGYDRDSWKLRNDNEYKIQYLKASTKAMRTSLVSQYGVRYSLLIQLPYFDIVRMHVVDPMHNLLLGTPKHMMNIWTQDNIISKTELNNISKVAALINVPRCIGRIPSKIASSFSGFSADQWKNWTLIYSAICLKDKLERNHLQCWLVYVRACSILVSRSISKLCLDAADQYLLQFCKVFQRLYGAQHCTINMHLHLHLKEIVLDYGPVYSFWCFSFERLNGILGDYFTNNHNIEVQFMKKFLMHQRAMTVRLPMEYDFLLGMCREKDTSGSLHIGGSNFEDSIILRRKLALSSVAMLKELDFSVPTTSMGVLLPPFHTKFMAPEMIEQLSRVYSHLYSDFDPLAVVYTSSSRASVAGQIIHSVLARTDKGSVISANWPNMQIESQANEDCMQFGVVQCFLEHTITIHQKNSRKHIFALVKWAKLHPQQYWFGQSATVCEQPSIYSYIPLQRIVSVCAHANIELNLDGMLENVFVVIPCIAML